MSKSAIEWTEDTWNPLAGCKEISPGCTNCYAARMAHRLAAMGQEKYRGTTKKLANGKIVWTGKISLDEAALQIPLKRKVPTTYFVNSMSDLFHEDVPFEYVDKICAVMAFANSHTFQCLTKRAERLCAYLESRSRKADFWIKAARQMGIALDWEGRSLVQFPLPNVWWGVSVENKKHGLPRIEHLLRTPAAVRFLSIEPLLENLGAIDTYLGRLPEDEDGAPYPGSIHWVIVGGESGPGARPMHPDWVRSIRDQCVAVGVPFFFKQWGAFVPFGSECGGPSVVLCSGHPRFLKTATYADGSSCAIGDPHYIDSGAAPVYRVGKKIAGRILDGRTWDEMPAKAVPA